MSKMAEGLKSRVSSEMVSDVNIMQISLQLLLIHHLMACSWYYVGTVESDGWVAKNMFVASVSYKYTTSLHWTFCQLGFGGTEIEPVNTAERIFGILVALLALAIFSTLLGTIASHMATLSRNTEERRSLFRQLSKFLGRQHIPAELALRIRCFLEHAYNLKQQTVLETKVPLLDLLSKPLRGELHCARYEGHLRQLDFLLLLSETQRADAVRRLAHRALQQRTYAATDSIFEAGNIASEAYFLTKGALSYVLGSEKHSVTKCRWLAEMSLWTPWLHLGELTASKDSEVLAIKVEQFHDSMRRSYDILHIAHQYAADYVEAMNHFVLVTDLWQKISDPARHDEQPIDPAGSPTLQTNRSKKSAGGTRGWLTTRFQRLVSKRKMADFSQIAPLN
ncbi:KCNH7 [Symbiodinium pilosum]|uniref:KCNH7 protein n=1 Tax=Symbiodinium pilosum TaxID=2952 RepID=A0A812M1G6_SYMPI|nr:KCNH7 [Symbiodinium pilosum]